MSDGYRLALFLALSHFLFFSFLSLDILVGHCGLIATQFGRFSSANKLWVTLAKSLLSRN